MAHAIRGLVLVDDVVSGDKDDAAEEAAILRQRLVLVEDVERREHRAVPICANFLRG